LIFATLLVMYAGFASKTRTCWHRWHWICYQSWVCQLDDNLLSICLLGLCSTIATGSSNTNYSL